MTEKKIGSGATPAEVKEQIADHEALINSGKCSKSACPACQSTAGFARKDIRRRKLRFFDVHQITAQLVVAVVSIRLARFRCLACEYVFSDYPDFRTPV